MPAVPFTHTHGESVDVLVECVKKCDGLDDHVVTAVHIKLDLGARKRVAKTKLSTSQVTLGHALE